MSAYIVDKDHISFLVNAAFKAAANDRRSLGNNGERHELTSCLNTVLSLLGIATRGQAQRQARTRYSRCYRRLR